MPASRKVRMDMQTALRADDRAYTTQGARPETSYKAEQAKKSAADAYRRRRVGPSASEMDVRIFGSSFVMIFGSSFVVSERVPSSLADYCLH